MDISAIKKLCDEKRFRWTNHIFVRLIQRGIKIQDIIEAINDGEIIEDYPEDYPYPSCLILGKVNEKYLHIVCGINEKTNELWFITAYYPDTERWNEGFRYRKEK